MTYEEMLGLNEEVLEARGVTKGARHKIVLSVRKLKERFSTMAQLEQDVVKGGSLRSALEELRAILTTPIKIPDQDCAEQDDLPRQFTKVLGKGKFKKKINLICAVTSKIGQLYFLAQVCIDSDNVISTNFKQF